MSFDGSYAAAAAKYIPGKTSVLFVAEAPPEDVDRYFYFENVEHDDWLWLALMKAIYPAEWGATKTERKRKGYWLLRFQDSQFQLIDAVKVPIRGTKQDRIRLIRSAAPELMNEIKKIAPRQIVLIKADVHEALFQEFTDAHLPVINAKSLPFPSFGRQVQFNREFRRLVDAGELWL